MQPKKIFVLGNPLVEQDSLPLKLIKPLSKKFPDIEFEEIDPTENLEVIGRNPVIIDTILGIKEVRVLTDIDKIELSPNYSMHDYDLGFNLKLLRKMDMLESVFIIGVPDKITKEQALEQISKEIKKL
ncbi:MAG: hypothetical protein ABIJ92_03350 [Candidatus Aenigmatarchaeota archaeon]